MCFLALKVYSGDFVNDKREGRGIYTWPDGSKYEGHFKANKRSGYGRFEFPNGNYFEVKVPILVDFVMQISVLPSKNSQTID